MNTSPNYSALVQLLPTLHTLVDACGYATLTVEDACKIRSHGFPAEAGRWKCPSLPPHLTCDNPLLEPLSVGWDERAALQKEGGQLREVTESRNAESSLTPLRSVESTKVVSTEPGPERCVSTQRTAPSREQLIEAAAIKIERKLKNAKPRESLGKRRLQQLLWRYPAAMFHEAVHLVQQRARIPFEIR